jgi:hypothetical protein
MSLVKLSVGILILLGVVVAPPSDRDHSTSDEARSITRVGTGAPTLTAETDSPSDGSTTIDRPDVVIPEGGLTSTPDMGSFTGWPMSPMTHDAPLGTDERLEFVVEGRLITGSGDHGVGYFTGCTNANCAAWGLRCVDASA